MFNMKIGLYKKGEEIVRVVQVDEENKRVEVDYGTHCHWWGEEEFSTWEAVEPEWVTDKKLEELGGKQKIKIPAKKKAAKKKAAPKKKVTKKATKPKAKPKKK